MFGWDDSRDAANQVYNGEPNQASWTHELVAGGAAFGAMKIFEDRQRKEGTLSPHWKDIVADELMNHTGKVVNHQFAKELLAGIAGAEVDKLAETKGEDAWDRHEAKKQAEKNAHHLYDQQYGQYDQYDPRSQPEHSYTENINIDQYRNY